MKFENQFIKHHYDIAEDSFLTCGDQKAFSGVSSILPLGFLQMNSGGQTSSARDFGHGGMRYFKSFELINMNISMILLFSLKNS